MTDFIEWPGGPGLPEYQPGKVECQQDWNGKTYSYPDMSFVPWSAKLRYHVVPEPVRSELLVYSDMGQVWAAKHLQPHLRRYCIAIPLIDGKVDLSRQPEWRETGGEV